MIDVYLWEKYLSKKRERAKIKKIPIGMVFIV